jgi:hypothetical protein
MRRLRYDSFRNAVIPTKAGIHPANLLGCTIDGLDSRFRRNECGLKHARLANDTTTPAQGCVKVAEKAALPPDLRKGFAFPRASL